MGSTPPTISIHFKSKQPFVAGQQVTGTVKFNNTLGESVKCQRIYIEFVGKVIHTTKSYYGHGHHYTTHREPFFQQVINLEEQEEEFALTNDYYSWPINFSLPTFLPPSLDQLSDDGPYIRYKARVIFERSEEHWNNIEFREDFPISVIASPSSCPQPSHLLAENDNEDDSDITVHATLADQKNSLAPGDNVLLNIKVHNPNHSKIKGLSIDLVQHRTIAMGKHCEQIFPLVDLPNFFRKFSGENYCEILQLEIPYDDRIIPSFYYMSPAFSKDPISVEYMLKLELKIRGLFNDYILNVPITVHAREMYMPSSSEEEAPPPPYEVAIATH